MPSESKSYEPDNVSEYANKEYWNQRFEKEDEFDWLGKYDHFKQYCVLKMQSQDHDKSSMRVLVLGCGNSTLSYDMHCDGFQDITSVDYSDIVIDKMRLKYSHTAPELKWVVQDVTNMSDFEEGTFDLVVDKGVLDALVADEGSQWDPHVHVVERVHKMLHEVYRVLRHGGRFVQVSFAQPHFRRNYLIPPIPRSIDQKGEMEEAKFYVLHDPDLLKRCGAGENLFGWHYGCERLPDVGFGYFVFLLDKPV